MPNRILYESIITSETLDKLTPEEERFFYRLMVVCDDFGRFDGRPAVIKGRCFPLKDEMPTATVAGWLAAIVRAGLVRMYESGGRPFLMLATWEDYQNIRAKKSKFPEPERFLPMPEEPNTSARICMQIPADVEQPHADAPVTRYSDLDTRISVSPVADAPVGQPGAPFVLTGGALQPVGPKARKTRDKPADPQLAPDRTAYLARYRQRFGAPTADFTKGGVFAFASLRTKHGMPTLMASLDGCADDEWTRTHRTLAWVCSQEGVEFGSRARAGPRPNAPESRQVNDAWEAKRQAAIAAATAEEHPPEAA